MAGIEHTDLRAQLQAERERLDEQIHELAPTGDLVFDEGFADSGQVTAERGEAEALASALRDTLSEIEDALGKIEAGTYGRCESCGGEIQAARLEAMPAARFCIACASRAR